MADYDLARADGRADAQPGQGDQDRVAVLAEQTNAVLSTRGADASTGSNASAGNGHNALALALERAQAQARVRAAWALTDAERQFRGIIGHRDLAKLAIAIERDAAPRRPTEPQPRGHRRTR